MGGPVVISEAFMRPLCDVLMPVGRKPVSSGFVVDLFLSYRAVKAWDDMIGLVSRMSAPLAQSVLVPEQLGLALDRAGEGRRGGARPARPPGVPAAGREPRTQRAAGDILHEPRTSNRRRVHGFDFTRPVAARVDRAPRGDGARDGLPGSSDTTAPSRPPSG